MKDRKITLSYSDSILIEQLLESQIRVFEDADAKYGDPSGYIAADRYEYSGPLDIGHNVNSRELTCREFEVWAESIKDRLFHSRRDATPPGPSDCPDCGEIGSGRGHMGCQYPSDDPNIEGLEDPMEFER